MKTKAALSLITLLLFAICLDAQPTKQNGWEILSLKGRVKAMSETIISVIDTHSMRAINYISEYTCNKNGYIITDNRLPLKGGYGKPMLSTKEYDSNNNCTKLTHDKHISNFKNEYDAHNNLVKQTEYDSLIKLKSVDSFIYNNAGQLVEKNYYNLKDSLPERTLITYDNKGAATHKRYSRTGLLRHISRYAADMSNNVVWERMYESDGSIYKTWIYKYDSKGNHINTSTIGQTESSRDNRTYNEHNDELTQTYTTYKPKKLVYKLTHVYEYDEHGNWISQLIYSNDEKIRTITREITYY